MCAEFDAELRVAGLRLAGSVACHMQRRVEDKAVLRWRLHMESEGSARLP